MLRLLFSFFVFVINFGLLAQNWQNYAVQLGEHSKHMTEPDSNTVRIFMDENGWYYPKSFIKDKEVSKCSNSLEQYWRKQCNNNRNIENLDSLVWAKNQTALKAYIETINRMVSKYDEVYFLIHGFRKRAYQKKDNATSAQDYDKAKKQIQGAVNKRILFVEIYWDSKHIKGVKALRNQKGLRLMEQSAIPSALNAGNELRKLVNLINRDSITVVSHSLGAVVLAELLFTNMELSTVPTPHNKFIRAFFVAPAIGSESFLAYNQRTWGTGKKEDRYQIYIIYNPNDFVLNKSFGAPAWMNFDALPTQFGSTTLGCNYMGDIDSLKLIFARNFVDYNSPVYVQIDSHANGKKMQCHHAHCYLRHPKFLELLH